MESDLEYYRRRMHEEQLNAKSAERSDVRSVHNKLAALYKARIRELSSRTQPLVANPGALSSQAAETANA